MSTWYFLYPKRLSFYPDDYDYPGLGGSEGSLVVLSRELARNGHHVQVFNCCYKPGIYEGVTWRHEWEIESAPPPDVLVSVRFQEAIRPHLRSRQRLYWMLDDRTQGAEEFIRTFGSDGGRIVVASAAMRDVLSRREVIDSTVEIPLPVESLSSFGEFPRGPICHYCSAPNRGLDVLLALWPSVSAQVNGAELWITGGYQMWGYTKEEADDRSRNLIEAVSAVSSVRFFGVVSRRSLAALRSSCALMTYPCRFREMFCLAAAECAAAGLPIVASDIGALSERVIDNETGYLIRGDISQLSVQQQFVDSIVSLLNYPERIEQMSHAARLHATHSSPPEVAARWSELLI